MKATKTNHTTKSVPPREIVAFTIPVELKAKIEAIALEDNRSRSGMISVLLQTHPRLTGGQQ